ncbi:hypothetical protein BU17DRAFT_56043 [Hysterangium stoloniferum]|nr:hypothetical protein BU17DRAFT_56043 [Hysterangium stoloniferum]
MAPGTVKWWPCDGPYDVEGSECGFIITPLDYFNVSAGVAKIALGRYKATTSPKKGMVVYGAGGPGAPGKLTATRLGPSYHALIGTDYDFVGFDARGIDETEPTVLCFGLDEYNQFTKHTVLDRGFDVGSNLSDPRTRDHLIFQQREADSLYKTEFDVCARTMGDTLKFMGSSTISRDVDFMTTVLGGEDALMQVTQLPLVNNYIGYSYGTILGAYLINMFPNRLGRVVLDGVVDAPLWTNEPPHKWYKQWLEYTDATYELFTSDCSKAGPDICPLALYQNEDPALIMGRLEDFFESLYLKPLAVPDAASPGILTSGAARVPLFIALQLPTTWKSTATAFHEAMQDNGSLLLTLAQRPPGWDLQRSAISCNDRPRFSPPSAEEVVDALLDVLKTVSRFGATVVHSEPDAGCHYWPVTPLEIFNGPWNHTLSNKILIHSNALDPVTPLSSGQVLKKRLGDSATLAIREGPGHCSFSLPSLCTAKITRKYFADGTLPEENHLCPVDVDPFDMKATIAEGLSENDVELLGHLQKLATVFNDGSHIRGPSV